MPRETCQADDLLGSGSSLSHRIKERVVDAGEDGDADHLDLRIDRARCGDGFAHHHFAARRVDVENLGSEPRKLARRRSDCVGNVVEFHVDKDRQSQLDDSPDAIGTTGRVELKADLQTADMIPHCS